MDAKLEQKLIDRPEGKAKTDFFTLRVLERTLQEQKFPLPAIKLAFEYLLDANEIWEELKRKIFTASGIRLNFDYIPYIEELEQISNRIQIQRDDINNLILQRKKNIVKFLLLLSASVFIVLGGALTNDDKISSGLMGGGSISFYLLACYSIIICIEFNRSEQLLVVLEDLLIDIKNFKMLLKKRPIELEIVSSEATLKTADDDFVRGNKRK